MIEYVKKGKKLHSNKNVKKILNEELKFGINKFNTFATFASKIFQIKKNVLKNIDILKKKFTNITPPPKVPLNYSSMVQQEKTLLLYPKELYSPL